jgi:hypothetical protein
VWVLNRERSTWVDPINVSTSARMGVSRNGSDPSLEVEQARWPETEKEMLPQQAPLQALPGGVAQGTQGP